MVGKTLNCPGGSGVVFRKVTSMLTRTFPSPGAISYVAAVFMLYSAARATWGRRRGSAGVNPATSSADVSRDRRHGADGR